MFKRKQKIKLSENLRMGIAGPSSQGALFKAGGVFFLILSLLLVANIYRNVKNSSEESATLSNQAAEQKVLGAFDEENKPSSQKPRTYTVKKGDTLFNIAQIENINWAVIAKLNNLKAPYTLKPGTVLTLEAAQ